MDISEDMISHCGQHHQAPGMTFQRLDTSQGGSFTSSHSSSFSLVTSFSCLHWVPDMPTTVSLFNNVLKPGGKFLFVVTIDQISSMIAFHVMIVQLADSGDSQSEDQSTEESVRGDEDRTSLGGHLEGDRLDALQDSAQEQQLDVHD